MAINSLSSASKGMSGLASGMDTQSMVDAMLAGTQAKIDKQKATKTQLQYKQTMYRDVLSALTGFQKNFMSYTGGNNLLTSGFYNTMNAVSKSTAFKATATSDAAAGKTVVNSISKLATAYKMTSGDKVSDGVTGKIDINKLAGQELQIELDGVRKTIKLPGIDELPTFPGDDDPKRMRAAIQTAINNAFGGGITVGGTGDAITFEATSESREFVISGEANAMAGLGLSSGVSNKVNTAVRLDQINFKTKLTGDNFKFTINGEKFEFLGSDDLDKVISKINSSDANVRLRYSALEDKFVMESTVSGKDAKITMSQDEGNLLTALFGVNTGNSVTGVKQNTYGSVSGKIGGVAADYTPGTPISDDAYMVIQDTLNAAVADINRMTKDADLEMKFLVNGKEVLITIPQSADGYTFEQFTDKINSQFASSTDLDVKNIKIELQKEDVADGGRLTGGVKLSIPDGTRLDSNTLFQSFFGTPANNITGTATGTTKLKDAGFATDFSFDVTGEKEGILKTESVNLTAGMTMDDAAIEIKRALTAAGANTDKVSVAFDESKGGFRIFGVDIPMTFEMTPEVKKLFGDDPIEMGKTAGTAGISTDGQNAELVINDIAVERNSNEFTIDGMSYELTSTFNEAKDVNVKEEISVARDTGKIFEGVSKFMEEYNKLVDKAWGLLKSEANYKDYPPLTDAQKESMSDREVELWENKSKEGLLRGDKLLEGIMSTMRNTLLAKPEGAKYSLAELGITTAYDMEKGYGGMLKFSDDAGTGDVLKKIIAEEPEEIEKLFADYDNGIMVELNKVLSGATLSSPVEKPRKYGELSLVNMAGNAGVDTSSTIYTQVRDINKNLENLNTKYKLEYSRYWKQFSAMEQAISSLNSQSSWLTQQFQ